MKPLLLGCTVLLAVQPLFALTLQEVVRDSINTNPEMQKQISDYRAIIYDLDKAKAGYKPTIDISGDIGPEHTDRRYQNIETDLVRKEAGVVATENLFAGFNTQSDVEEQEHRIVSARQEVMQKANMLALEVTGVYLEVLKQKTLLDLEKENVRTHERIYGMIREKTAQGLGRRSDVEQTEGRLSLAYANYISQLNNYQDTLVNLERLYGRPITAEELETPASPTLPEQRLEALHALAIQYHPTLMIEQANISVKDAQYRKEKSTFYPTLDAELSADYRDNVDGSEEQIKAYRAMLRLRYNLYNGGYDEATRLQNLQEVTTQKTSLHEQMRAVAEKLNLSWMSYQLMSRRLPCTRLHRELSLQTSASYAEEYQLGRRSLLDLLNVELEATDARKLVTETENELLLSRFRILESLGLLSYALNTGLEEKVDAELPEDVTLAFAEAEADKRPMFTDYEGLNIYDMCLGKQTDLSFSLFDEDNVESVADKKADDNDSERFVMNAIRFEFDSDALTDQAAGYVKEVARTIVAHPEYHVSIYAYTDATASDAYNLDLSQRRAERVKNALAANGVRPEQLDAVGKGEKDPIADNATLEGRAKNRRVEFALTRQ